MEDFRRQFLLEAVETLRNLLDDLRAADNFSESLKRESFRTLHTVKGTAQTFGFDVSSRLAHELESIIAAENSQPFLLQGIELLIESLNGKNFEIPDQFIEKLQIIAPASKKNLSDADFFLPEIPREFFSQLSAQEKNSLRSAIRENDNLYCLEIEFKPENFAGDLINFREFLNQTGNIIATFPGSNSRDSGGNIGFQMLVASNEKLPSLERFGAIIVFQKFAEHSGDATGVLEQIVRYGKAIAESLGKRIEITTSGDETKVSPENLKIIFDALLHLIRNAVDHAVENEGTIEISLSNDKSGVRLIISDDGRGFDLEKIKAKAVEKSLVDSSSHLSEEELISLIFSPEFSTKANVTEISGRGIGLDAVKFVVEKSGGEITAKNRTKAGATFEIFLPQ